LKAFYGFLNFLAPYYTDVTDGETGFHISKFVRELRAGDVDAFMERLRAFFAFLRGYSIRIEW
jgi:hypothetical protein